jgi:hypothetical protein
MQVHHYPARKLSDYNQRPLKKGMMNVLMGGRENKHLREA